MKVELIKTDFRKLSNLINQLDINYRCFTYLHSGFEKKQKELNDVEYHSFQMKREVCYLRLCYWNHFSEIVNILYTLFLPSKKKEEITFKNIDRDVEDDKEYAEIVSKYKSLKLINIRNKTTAHKSAETLHSFFHFVQYNIENAGFGKLCNLLDSFLKWAFNRYKGDLAKIVNSGNMYSGVITIFNNIENNQTLEDVYFQSICTVDYDDILFDRILKIAVNSSVLRNQVRKKNKNQKENILENIRYHLKVMINLMAVMNIQDENTFQKFLNSWTINLENEFKANKLKWGSARKTLNVLLEELYLNYHMRKYVKNVSNYLEIPVDSKVYKKLKEIDPKLPNKFTISSLSKIQNNKYQQVAKDLAKTYNLKRVELDAVFWTIKQV